MKNEQGLPVLMIGQQCPRRCWKNSAGSNFGVMQAIPKVKPNIVYFCPRFGHSYVVTVCIYSGFSCKLMFCANERSHTLTTIIIAKNIFSMKVPKEWVEIFAPDLCICVAIQMYCGILNSGATELAHRI